MAPATASPAPLEVASPFSIQGAAPKTSASTGGEFLGLVGGAGYIVTVDGAAGNQVATTANTSLTLNGSNVAVSLATGNSLLANGGGNSINAGAGDLIVIANTHGNYDEISSTGDVSGGLTNNGSQGTGIVFANNAEANVFGNNNTISLNSTDALGAYGGGNTIDASAGDLVVIGNTAGNYDEIYSTGDASGGLTNNGSQGTGIIFANSAEANVFGAGNTISLNSTDALGAYGGGNTINASAGDLVVIGNTAGVGDVISSTGDASGGLTAQGTQGTGIILAANSQMTLRAVTTRSA